MSWFKTCPPVSVHVSCCFVALPSKVKCTGRCTPVMCTQTWADMSRISWTRPLIFQRLPLPIFGLPTAPQLGKFWRMDLLRSFLVSCQLAHVCNVDKSFTVWGGRFWFDGGLARIPGVDPWLIWPICSHGRAGIWLKLVSLPSTRYLHNYLEMPPTFGKLLAVEGFQISRVWCVWSSWPAESIYYSRPGPITSSRELPAPHNKTPNNTLFLLWISIFSLRKVNFLRPLHWQAKHLLFVEL